MIRQHTFAILVVLSYALAAVPADKIINLPGAPSPLNFEQYSGYLQATGERKLHYWLVESQNDPSSDPLLVWMNGGPGCSSLDGLLYENGPLLVNDDGATLRKNPYAWNKVANVLYLEAPVGVGFSYSPNPKDLHTDDWQTASANYAALLDFFSKFPEYRSNELYISGESYGGIYVPTLTYEIVQGNAANTSNQLNLKGFAVGNGLESYAGNDDSLVEFAYAHGLVGVQLWAELQQHCQGNYHNSTNPACHNATAAAMATVYSDGINWYNMYAPCYHQPDAPEEPRVTRSKALIFTHLQPLIKQHMEAIAKSRAATAAPKRPTSGDSGDVGGFNVPCINSTGGEAYLSRPDVIAAIHVKTGLPPWAICSSDLHYTPTIQTIVPTWKALLTQQGTPLRALWYNGDTDMACNFLGEERAVASLGLPLRAPRRPWTVAQQNAGFVTEYEGGATFLTVRGSGHMVPQFKPPQALHMITAFLQQTPY